MKVFNAFYSFFLFSLILLGCQKEPIVYDNLYVEINQASGGGSTSTLVAPSNLLGSAQSVSAIKLTWKDNSKNETGFVIERKTQNSSYTQIASLAANTITYNDLSLTEGILYSYRVKAYKGTSLAYSNETFLTTLSDVTTGIVAYFPFNGNANDVSGNGNNGTVSGATLTTDRFGISSKAYSFDGSTNYIQLPLLSALNGISKASFSFWIKNPNMNKGAMIGHWGNNGGAVGVNAGLIIGNYSGSVYTMNYSGCCASISSILSGTENWIHVVANFDGTKVNSERINFYINGVLSNNTIGTTYSTIGIATSSFIGRRNIDNNNYGDYYQGILDDVRIYSRTLTSAQVQYLFLN
ncbi:MAG: LamG-like jellyroll fold domain-containing protein [Chitinophagaceae bacterium]